MSTTDDSEEDDNKIPGSTEDDYAPIEKDGSDADTDSTASAPKASQTQTIASTVTPKPTQTTQLPQPPKVDPTDIINQPPPAVNAGDLEKPETLTPPQEPALENPDDPNANVSANLSAINKYYGQVETYNKRLDQQQARQKFLSQKKANNQAAIADAKETGRQYSYDDQGILRPKTDLTTGQQEVKERLGPVQYDTNGKPFQTLYNENGKAPTIITNPDGTTSQVLDKKIINPDADAKIAPNPNDPSDTNLYKQNQYSQWETIDPKQGMLSSDNATAIASAKFLHAREIKNTRNQRADLTLQNRQIAAQFPGSSDQTDDSEGATPTETTASGIPTTIPAGGFGPKTVAKIQQSIDTNKEAAPEPAEVKGFFGGINQEATAKAKADWQAGENQRQSDLAQAQNLLSADQQIKANKAKILDLDTQHQKLIEEGPGGYLNRKRQEGFNSIANMAPEDAQAAIETGKKQIGQSNVDFQSSLNDWNYRKQQLEQNFQNGGTAADMAQWRQQSNQLESERQSLQEQGNQNQALVQQINNGITAQQKNQQLEQEKQRAQLRMNPATANTADQLDSIDQDQKFRQEKLDSNTFLDPDTKQLAQGLLDADIQDKRVAAAQKAQSDQFQADQDLDKQARSRMDLQAQVESAKADYFSNSEDNPFASKDEYNKAQAALDEFDKGSNSKDVQKRQSQLEDDDNRLKFSGGEGYTVLHNGVVAINPKALLPDGMRPQGMDSWQDQISAAKDDGNLTAAQADYLTKNYTKQAQATQGQIVSNAIGSNAFQDYLKKNNPDLLSDVQNGNRNAQIDAAAQDFLKITPTALDRAVDSVRKAWQGFESGTGIPAALKLTGDITGSDFISAMGSGVTDQQKANDPRLQNSFLGGAAETVGSLAGFAAGGEVLKTAMMGLKVPEAAAQIISMGAVGGVGAAQSAQETYKKAIDAGQDKDTAIAAGALSGVVNLAMLLPFGHYLQTFAAPIKSLVVQGTAKIAIEAASFAALNAGTTLANNAIAKQFIDKNQDLFENVGDQIMQGGLGGAILGVVSSAVGHVRLNALKQKYNLPSTWSGKAEDLMVADKQIQALNTQQTGKDWAKQRNDLVAQLTADPSKAPDLAPQIAALNFGIRVDPLNIPAESRPDLASALLKVSQGSQIGDLSETEKSVLNKAKTSSGVGFIDDHNGAPIITDTAKAWLQIIAPHAAEMIGHTGQKAKDAIDAKLNSVTGNENQETSQQSGVSTDQEGGNQETSGNNSQATGDQLQSGYNNRTIAGDDLQKLADARFNQLDEKRHGPIIGMDENGKPIQGSPDTILTHHEESDYQFLKDNPSPQEIADRFGYTLKEDGETQTEGESASGKNLIPELPSPEGVVGSAEYSPLISNNRKTIESSLNSLPDGQYTLHTAEGEQYSITVKTGAKSGKKSIYSSDNPEMDIVSELMWGSGKDKDGNTIWSKGRITKAGEEPAAQLVGNADSSNLPALPLGKAGGLVTPEELSASKKISDALIAKGVDAETAGMYGDYFVRRETSSGFDDSTAQQAVDEFTKAGGMENPQAIVDSIKVGKDSEQKEVDRQYDAIISKLQSAPQVEGKPHYNDLSEKQKTNLSFVLKRRILPELSLFRTALTDVSPEMKGIKGGSGIGAFPYTLDLKIQNLLESGNLEHHLNDASIERIMNEEACHVAGILALSESYEKRTGIDSGTLSGSHPLLRAALDEGAHLYAQLPDSIKQTVENIRGGSENAGYSGLEFFRMLLQGDLSVSKEGNVVKRGAVITEETLPVDMQEHLKGLLRRSLARMAKMIKRFDEILRGHLKDQNINKADAKMIRDHFQSIRDRQLEIFQNFQKSADEIRNQQYRESYATKDDAAADKGKGRGHESNDSRRSDQGEGLLASKNGRSDAGTNSESGGDTQATSDQRGTGGGPTSSVLDNPNQPEKEGDWNATVPKSNIQVRLHKPGPVELSDIQSSAGTELQPRNRSRAGNKEQETKMASDWKPGLAKAGDFTDRGPIIYGKVGGKVVNLSGHGRQNAQSLIYERNGPVAKANRAWIKQEMKRNGYSKEEIAKVDSMKAPVWAAELAHLGEYHENGSGLLGLVRDSNVDGMSKGELAASDANLLSRIQGGRLLTSLHVSENGNILDIHRNKETLDAIYRSFSSPRELKNSDGQYNKEFEARLRGSLLAYAIGSDHTDLITRLVEDTGGIKNLADGIMYAAPELAKTKAEGGVDIGGTLLEPAIKTLLAFKADAGKFDNDLGTFLNQYDFLREQNPAAEKLLLELASRNRSARKIGEFLSETASNEAKKAAEEKNYDGNLFGPAAAKRATSDLSRLRKLQSKQRSEGLDRWETQELTNLEKRAGQHFMGLFDEAKNPEADFSLEQEIESRGLTSAPAEQLALLARGVSEKRRKAADILKELVDETRSAPYREGDEGSRETRGASEELQDQPPASGSKLGEPATGATPTAEARGERQGLRNQEEQHLGGAGDGSAEQGSGEVPKRSLAPVRVVDHLDRDPRVREQFKDFPEPVRWNALGLPEFDSHALPYLQRETLGKKFAEIKEGSSAHSVLGMRPGLHAREKLHQAIVDYFLNGGYDRKGLHEVDRPESQENPEVLFLGGGGGSGKSTILKKEIKEGKLESRGRVWVNPDEVRELIPEYELLNEGADIRSSKFTHEEASAIADQIQKIAEGNRFHIIKDGTMKSEEKGLKQIRDLREKGYTPKLLGVTIDPHEAMVRATIRGYFSKRFVPSDVLLDAHKGFNSAVAAYVKEMRSHGDQVLVVDNTPPEPQELDLDQVEAGTAQQIAARAMLEPKSKTLDDLLNSYLQTKQLEELQPASSRSAFNEDMESQVEFFKKKADEAGYKEDLSDTPLEVIQNWASEWRNGHDRPASVSSRRGSRENDDSTLDLFAHAGPEIMAYDKALTSDGITHPQAQAQAAIQDLGIKANQALDLFGNTLTESKSKRKGTQQDNENSGSNARSEKTSFGRLNSGRKEQPSQERGLGDLFSGLVGQREAERDRSLVGGTEGDLFSLHGQQDSSVPSGNLPGGDGSSGRTEGSIPDDRAGGAGGAGGAGTDARTQGKSTVIAQPGSGIEITRPPVGSPGRNISLDRNDQLAPRGTVSKLKANLSALKIVKALSEENRPATEAEKKELVKFSGWGALSQAFDDEKARQVDSGQIEELRKNAKRYRDYGDIEYYKNTADAEEKSAQSLENWKNQWHDAHNQIKELLSPEEYQAAKESTINAHYTSPKVVAAMWDLMTRLGFKGGNVLEPGAGIGHFFGLMPDSVSDRSRLYGVELDPYTSKILRALYPEADIQNTGYQTADIADNSIDLAISNVPFANVPVKDAALEAMGGPTSNLHDYYFGKTLTKLKPGGVMAFITSAFTMDKGNAETRKWLADRGDLIAAYRLPNDAFKENAGTDVTTDIIVIRKKDGSPFAHGNAWTNLGDSVTQNGNPIRVNEYFARNPSNILGKLDDDGSMYGGKKEMTVHSDENNPAEIAIQQGISTLPEGIMGEIETHGPVHSEALTVTKQGNIIQKEGKYFFSGQDEPDEKLNDPKNAKRVAAFMSLRDALNRQYDLELSDTSTDEQIDQNRVALNRAYDAFVKDHKDIHNKANKSLFIDDPDYFRLAGAEIPKDGKKGLEGMLHELIKGAEYQKADVFSKRVLTPRTEPTRADNLEDAMGISLGWRNHIDTQFIAGLTGKTIDQVEKGLISREIAFKDPSTGQLQSREEYLSGNVVKKLAVAEASGPEYASNVKLLKESQPERVPLDQIGYNIGATWVPEDIYTKFLRSLGIGGRSFKYIDHADRSGWEMQKDGSSAYGNKYKEFETPDVPVHAMMDSLLNFRPITVNLPKKEGGGRDHGATALAREKAKALNEEFKKWVGENPEIAKRMEDSYNTQANTSADRTYDGQHLVFPWANKDFNIYPDKKNTVWRAIQEGSGLIAHGVGGGKTIIGTSIALEMRRLGMSKKPMIVVHNATLEGFAKEITKMAPSSRVLIGRKDELKGAKRKEFLMRIAAGDWDAVVLAHSTFKTISDDPEVIKAHSKDIIDDAMDALKEKGYDSLFDATADRKKDPSVKSLVKTIQKMQKNIETAADKQKENDEGLLNFQQLGVDSLIVDEVHAFKKMPFSTTLEAKGIDGSHSDSGYSLLMRAREIQKKTGGKNVFGMTGTPITNTMGEIWNLIRLTSPNVLNEFNVRHFDQFHSKYAEVRTESELGPGGEYKNVNRLSAFMNLPEWYRFLRAGADVKLGEDLVVKNRPEIKGGTPELVAIERTPGVTAWVQHIRGLLQDYKELSGEEKKANPALTAVPVQSYMASKAAAIDIRMIEPRAKEEAGSKLNQMVKRAKEIYDRTSNYNGTQVIFSDSINAGKTDTLDSVRPHDNIGIELDPTKGADATFDLYKEIKNKLIAQGVPEKEIANIQDDKYKKDETKQKLFDDINEGKVRIVIGSTQKLGTGVNMQERMIAAHHLDAPWGPADMEQRDGRVYRQGNIHAEMGIPVEIYRYGMMDTLDSAIWQKLATKQSYTYAGLSGRVIGRRMEDDTAGLTYDEQQAVLGGAHSRRIFEIKNRLEQLRTSKAANEADAFRRSQEKAAAQNHVRIMEEQIQRITPSLNVMEELGKSVASEGTNITINGKSFDTKAAMADAIKEELEKAQNAYSLNEDGSNKAENVTSISVNGKPLFLHARVDGFTEIEKNGSMIRVPKLGFDLLSEKKDTDEDLSFGRVSSAGTLFSRLEELTDTVEGIRDSKQNNLKRSRELASMEDAKPWPYQAEYDKLHEELASEQKAYEEQIKADTAQKPTSETSDNVPQSAAARGVINNPDQLELDFNQAQADRDAEKSPAERLKESEALINTQAALFSNIPGYDKDEARQAARLAVAKAAKGYDALKGYTFASYAKQAVRNSLRTLYRDELNHATHYQPSLDNPVGDDGTETAQDFARDEKTLSASDNAAMDETRGILNAAISELPDRMQQAIQGFMDGDNGEEIASRMGISRQAVNNLQKAAMNRLHQKLNEKGLTSSDALLSRGVSNDGSPEDIIGEYLKRAKSEEGGSSPYKYGTPEKAYSASLGSEGRAVDQAYQDKLDAAKEDENNPRTQAAWIEKGKNMVSKDAKGTEEAIMKKGYSGDVLTPEETMAARIISNKLQAEAAKGDASAFQKFADFWTAYRQTGSAASDAMNSRKDLYMSPTDRHRAFLMDTITKPSKKLQDLIKKGADPAQVKEMLSEETKAVFEKLKAAGISPQDILQDKVALRLVDKQAINSFRSALARAALSASDLRKQAFDMILKNKSLDAIAKATGIKAEDVQKIKNAFVAKMRADHFEKFKAGAKADSESLLTGKQVPIEQANREFDKWMRKLGIVPDSEQGKPKFSIEDPAHVMRMRNAIAKIKGDSTTGDKLYEVWVNGLLSGPQTHVAIAASNSAAVAWDATIQRGMEALINHVLIHDPNAASFGELKVMLKGIIPSIGKAYNIAARGWAAEHDFYQSTVLGTPDELNKDNEFSRPGHISGQKGRIIRLPGRAVLFADHMFTTTYGHVQVGAEAYRIAKAEGLKGQDLTDRVQQLSQTRGEVIAKYSKANPPSEKMVQFFAKQIAALRDGVDSQDLVDDEASDAWTAAREQSAYDAAKKDGWTDKAWQKAFLYSKEVTFKQELQSKKEGGNSFEDIASKLQDARSGNLLLSSVFPFVRTPYNIFRIGVRKSPLGAGNLLAMATKGLYSMKNGRPYLEGHPTAVRDLAEQALAWGGMALLISAFQGDKDDDTKKLLITGSPEQLEEKNSKGTRELNERVTGGGYVIRVGGRNGISIPFGRLEPFATVLGTTADIVRGIKRNGSPSDDMAAVWNFIVGQVKDKSFLQGINSISDLLEGRNDPVKAVKKTVLQALVPNLIRSPLRSTDDYVRDYKTASPLYDALPSSGNAQPKIDPYGEPVEKSGNALVRFFVSTPLKESPELHSADKLLVNWNHENPSEAWAPESPKAVFKGKDGREVKMTGEEATKFRIAAGRLAVAKLRGVVNPRNMENPKREDLAAVKKAFESASHEAKERIFNPGYIARRNLTKTGT